MELFFEVPVQDDRIAGVATPNGMVLPNRALFVKNFLRFMILII